MDSPFIVPLGLFAMVVIILGIINLVKIREQETEVHQKLFQEEMEHRRRMQELDLQLAQLKKS